MTTVSGTRTRPLAVLLLVLALCSAQAPARAAFADQTVAKRQGSSCAVTATGMSIGSKILMKELGKSGVTQMQTTYRLYDENPTESPTAVATKTRTGPTFANDKADHTYASSNGNKVSFTVANGEWWIVAELTWVRPGRTNWTKTLPAAYCALQEA